MFSGDNGAMLARKTARWQVCFLRHTTHLDQAAWLILLAGEAAELSLCRDFGGRHAITATTKFRPRSSS
jgi:hypothetical protein